MNAEAPLTKRSMTIVFAALLWTNACKEEGTSPDDGAAYPEISREESLAADAVKMTPETDPNPPVLHLAEWEDPIPLGPTINTAGAEDSPFIPSNRDELYFFFTPVAEAPAETQVTDGVSGIYWSKLLDGEWQSPVRVHLQEPGKLALDGAEFVQGDDMLFASTREGYVGIHWFSAVRRDGQWTDWQPADFDPEYDVGELHIHDDTLYYHSARTGGQGDRDIWKLTRVDGVWTDPENVTVLNTQAMEGWPYISPDGGEIWFTRTYEGTPAVFRSLREGDSWSDPELVVSRFSGEPTLDSEGNLYFTHIYYEDDRRIEADIFVAYRK